MAICPKCNKKIECLNKISELLNAGIKSFQIIREKDDFEVIKIVKKTKYNNNFIIFNGKFYFLVDKDNNIKGKSRNLEDLVPKSVINQL
tara:strand:+ start:1123 stop:1389 length:267 start_codon:yes stop_codon:yes gene_type:complete